MPATKKHILVVEDEQHLAVGIKFNLEAEGYRVTTVSDGPLALKILREDPDGVDLLILDLMLPGMSGYAVCQTLRDRGYHMPVLILSARTLAEDRTRGFDVGADQYLSKPFDLDELFSRVKNLLSLYSQRVQKDLKPIDGLDKSGPEIEDTFEFGQARINFRTYEVQVAGKLVRMTRLEMALLQYFVTHCDRVVSRHELLENVWGLPGHMHTRAPDQFIRRLRKIFEPDPAHPQHFLTLRDTGYRFVPQPETQEDVEGPVRG